MKKSTIGTVLITSTLSLLSVGFISSQQAFSFDDDKSWDFSELKKPGVLAVKNESYKQECGSCHMAYSPGLLPKKSWIKVMDNLEEHYGDNAELTAQLHVKILNYLTTNSADVSDYKRSRKIMASLDKTQLTDRITLTPYFIRKHDEIPKRFVIDNPKVGSFSQCNLCHSNTVNGSFSEDEVSIPGVGYWHD
tara:strand:- start:20433 stop:21008 length:576 start_codon:yes stop_codon:yes gene_type:complete